MSWQWPFQVVMAVFSDGIIIGLVVVLLLGGGGATRAVLRERPRRRGAARWLGIHPITSSLWSSFIRRALMIFSVDLAGESTMMMPLFQVLRANVATRKGEWVVIIIRRSGGRGRHRQ